jgi:hypothetical protein
MMRYRAVRSALTSTAILLFLTPGIASANLYRATYTGLVIGGEDLSGVFGVPNTPLNNTPFTAIFTYDTAVGARSTDPGLNDEVYGGTVFSLPSPVSATLDINGVTQAIAGYYSGAFTAQPGLVFGAVTDHTDFTDGYLDNYLSVYALAAGATASLDNTFPSESATNSPATGGFNILTFHSDTNTYSVYAYGGFETDTVQISSVPEPCTLPIFASGLALMGRLAWCKKLLPISNVINARYS